ncbi:MAG: CPBP family intramembrane metalloprotease [Clostridia bacterium]|nr:CPBP family intramembrane metalloprotease [Clostridia bacterium]MBQ6703785.1 CPBP family intramembrane metalloprotease [Clostridia bacterium]
MKQSLKTLIRILVILLLYFLTQALVMTVFAAIGSTGAQGDIQGTMEAFLAEKAALISLLHNGLVIFCLLLYRHKSPAAREALPFKALSLKEAAICLCSGMCFAFLVSMVLSLLPIPEAVLTQYSSSLEQSIAGSAAERLLAAALFAPIGEELLFRGAIYGSFKKTYRRFIAIAASCALFGLMHQDPIRVIYAFLMGLGLTLTLDAYGTLSAPILLHMGFNFAGLVMTPNISDFAVFLLIGAPIVCVLFIRHAMSLSRNIPPSQGDNK